MTDVIGPIVAIALIFGVYWLSQQLDVLGDTKKSRLELSKIDAQTRQKEAEVRKAELDVQMGRLAIEARRLDYNPTGATEAEFKVLKELEDKRRGETEQ